jgi:hypothetical protein
MPYWESMGLLNRTIVGFEGDLTAFNKVAAAKMS